MIKVYCLDYGDGKTWVAAKDIIEAAETIICNTDSEQIEEGFELRPIDVKEMGDEVEDEEGNKISWLKIVGEIDADNFPCIIGEQC